MSAKGAIILVALLALAVGRASAEGPSNVLVYDHNTYLQVGISALDQLGWSYTRAYSGTFNGLLRGGTSWDLVLFDCPTTRPVTGGAWDLGPLTDYVNAGGRAVMSFWELDQYPGLAEAFEVSVHADFFTPRNVYRWDVTDPVFAGVGDLTQWQDRWADNGDYLTALSGAVALGGFTATAEPNSAAIVRGNSGRTYVNGFLFDDPLAGDGFDNMVQLVANECLLASRDYRAPSGDDSPELATWTLVLCTGVIGSALRRRRS